MKTTIALTTLLLTATAWSNSSVTASNKIGLKLAAETAKLNKGKNFMVSPLSLQQALTLAGNGSNASTRLQVETLLGSSLENLNHDSSNLVKRISFSKAQALRLRTQAPYTNPSVLSINNSIWNTTGKTDGRHYQFSSGFKSIASQYYNAEALSADFMQPAATDAINGWANKKTNGLIKEIIDNATTKKLLWVIMNATYLEASWAAPFYKMGDSAPAFTTLDAKQVKVPMISSQQYIAYAKTTEGEIATIKFDQNAGTPDLEFVVFLPKKGADFAKSQTLFFQDGFIKKAATAAVAKANVVLPKFSFDTSVEMTAGLPITKAMGLDFLFNDHADFSLMATADSLASIIGIIKQNSRIELDEKGVKAAAVTIIGGIEATSMPQQPTVSLVVDRPFMFAIKEKTTGAVLFAGSVINPR